MTSRKSRSNTIVIAEIGVNHNGDIDVAKRLISEAKTAGADYVKFQTFKAEGLTTSEAKLAPYQQIRSDATNQKELLKQLELDYSAFLELKSFSESAGVGFLTTAHDFESLDFVLSLDLDFIKVPSGDLTNLPLLEVIASAGKDVILSTGMSELSEVAAAARALETNGLSRKSLTILHCTSEYPAQLADVNLRAMVAMGGELSLEFGYSDHTSGPDVATAAVALGAKIIEKHLTLDKSWVGPDHSASANVAEFRQMVKSIRNIELALGSAEKSPGSSEKMNREVVRKSVVARAPIRAGDLLTAKNITVKRPGSGVSPMLWHQLIGSIASRDYETDEMIELS